MTAQMPIRLTLRLFKGETAKSLLTTFVWEIQTPVGGGSISIIIILRHFIQISALYDIHGFNIPPIVYKFICTAFIGK